MYVYVCVCCVFEFVPNSLLGNPTLSFSLSCFENIFPFFSAFLLILRQVNKLRRNSGNIYENLKNIFFFFLYKNAVRMRCERGETTLENR